MRQEISDLGLTRNVRSYEQNILNDALNTFYLQLYGVIHMVEDNSDSERGNPMTKTGFL